jgi:sporulation protein YlmC with PRC-barrel domain
MQLLWHELVGSTVVDADGRSLGRLTDLVAEPDGDDLQIAALIVGRRGLVRRVARPPWLHGDADEIPWSRVGDIGRRTIILRADLGDAQAGAAR